MGPTQQQQVQRMNVVTTTSTSATKPKPDISEISEDDFFFSWRPDQRGQGQGQEQEQEDEGGSGLKIITAEEAQMAASALFTVTATKTPVAAATATPTPPSLNKPNGANRDGLNYKLLRDSELQEHFKKLALLSKFYEEFVVGGDDTDSGKFGDFFTALHDMMKWNAVKLSNQLAARNSGQLKNP